MSLIVCCSNVSSQKYKKILLIPYHYWSGTLRFMHDVGVIHSFVLSHRVHLTNMDSLRLKAEVVVCTEVWICVTLIDFCLPFTSQIEAGTSRTGLSRSASLMSDAD